MAIPNFGLLAPTTTLGEYDTTVANTVGYNSIISTAQGTISDVVWKVPSSILTSPIITVISDAPASDIKTTTQGTISDVVWKIPSSTLTSPIITVISNAPASDIKTTSSGASTNYGAVVPSVGMGALFSTHIYTSNTLITSIGGTTPTTSAQAWYMS